MKRDIAILRAPMRFDHMIDIVQQRVHLADDMLDYGPGEYRVVSVDMPASGHIINATTAACKVGHESTPQFSREYRRLFGAPPMQDIKKLRTTP